MKQTKFLLGACLALTLAGCSDEVGLTADQLPVSGDEIHFGAAAGQFTEPAHRTVYGFVGDENYSNYSCLDIKWVSGTDQVRVYCPNTSEQQWADYTVMGDETNGHYLQRSDVNAQGVRWGDDLTTEHKFYSFYPLKTSNKDAADAPIEGLKNGTTVTATIPTAQLAGKVTSSSDQQTGRTWHVVAPDMSYAMMVGKGTWTPGQAKNIKLNYTPIVTVLDIYVNGPANDAGQDVDYTVTGVGVRSADQPIVGTFDYDVETDKCTYRSPESGSQDDNWAYVEVAGQDGNGLSLAPGDGMNVKFFLLPQNIEPEELTVYVFLSNGSVLRQPLGEGDGSPLAKGEIVKVLTPRIKPAETSNWMSAISDDVLFASQLSLPGTKHSYSYLNYEYNSAYPWQPSNAESNTYNANTDMMQTYQTLDIGQQFDAGVRAFNIKVYGNPGSDIYVAGDHSDRLQLDDFLTTLSAKLDEARTEFAIVTIDFVQDDNAYTAQDWLDRVCATIDNWSAQNQTDNMGTADDGTTDNDAETDYFRNVTAETTVGVMRHGIGVVIFAPGDQTNSSTNVNIVNNYPTSVQQTALWNATMSSGLGSADITIQNLEQNNSPSPSEGGLGLNPYFITEQIVLNGTSMDLITTKKGLITQLMRESWSNNNGSTSVGEKTSHLYLNDLSGFCVVNNTESTGSVQVGTARSRLIIGTWGDYKWELEDATTYTDAHNIPSLSSLTDFTTLDPNPGIGDRVDNVINRANSEVGHGGNNALLAEKINPYAESEIRRFVNDGRTPLGIVFMSFAGTQAVEFNGTTYTVNGTTLPALIVANNFKFALATQASTQGGN